MALSVNGGKLTARMLARVLQTAARKIRQEHKNHKTPHGRQTVGQLMAHGAATSSIEVDAPRQFDKVARRWNMDYAFYKTGPNKYLLFFKSGQADAITVPERKYTPQVDVLMKTRKGVAVSYSPAQIAWMGGDDMEKIRVAVYCRVAHDDTFSLEAQVAELRRYAEQAGYTIVSVMAEHGSGLTLDRPALKAVTEAVCKHKANMLLVKNLSRIGRDWGMVQEYIDFLNQHKITLLCVSEDLKISNRNLFPLSGHEKSEVSLQDA